MSPLKTLPIAAPMLDWKVLMKARTTRQWLIAVCVGTCFWMGTQIEAVAAEAIAAEQALPSVPASPAAPSDAQLRMLEMLLAKVQSNPGHSDSWRSLGRMQKALGQTDEAVTSTRKALELDPYNAAAHFDLGTLLHQVSRGEAAKQHFQEVLAIAPESTYADQVRTMGLEIPENVSVPSHAVAQLGMPTTDGSAPVISPGSPAILPDSPASLPMSSGLSDTAMQADPLPAYDPFSQSPTANPPTQTVGYEIQTFDGSDDLENRLRQLEEEAESPGNAFRIYLETGLLYNTNVTLTPISRDLAQDEQASFQWYASPDMDWKLFRNETSRAGVLFRGYFTANESQFQEFNLASFQPGAFAERDFTFGGNEVIGRMEYVFSNDFFDGNQVGNRHAGTASVTVIRPDLNAWYGYTTVAQSDFEDDGVTPDQTSLDGTTITFGGSHFKRTAWESLPMLVLGTDLEYANTKGDDYRYLSVNLHGSTDWSFWDRWTFTPAWGVGYRNYPDFTDPVGRDEIFWRVHGKLTYQWTEQWSVSTVAGHDRFASDNESFDTERSEVGFFVGFKR